MMQSSELYFYNNFRMYQLEMLSMEKMISAMYDIIKSLLNIKPRQLKSTVSYVML
jgi:hypothetical protein